MKKLMTMFGAILFASLIITSCGGSSIDSDAKRVAKMQCKAQELMEKAASGDMSAAEESTKLASEAASLVEEMEKKYTSEADQQKFTEAVLKELGKCE